MKPNELKAEMARNNDNGESLANALGISRQTLSNKFSNNNSSDFNRAEIEIIKERYNLTADRLAEIFLPRICLNKTKERKKYMVICTPEKMARDRVSQWVRTEMALQDTTQKAVAKALNVPQSAISRRLKDGSFKAWELVILERRLGFDLQTLVDELYRKGEE